LLGWPGRGAPRHGPRRGRSAARGKPQTPTKKANMNTLEKLKVHKTLSALTVAVGFVLMSGKIYADSEPGAIPMLLVVLGTGWYLAARVRTRSRRR
jgi:hypothetical protein